MVHHVGSAKNAVPKTHCQAGSSERDDMAIVFDAIAIVFEAIVLTVFWDGVSETASLRLNIGFTTESSHFLVF